MKPLLLYRDRNFHLEEGLPPHHHELVKDLALDLLFDAMAGGDQFLRDVASKAVLSGLTDPTDIAYRQQVLHDCLAHPGVIATLYAIAVEAIERERKIYHSFFQSPESVLHRSVEVMEVFVSLLKQLRSIADQQAHAFRSEGFVRFFRMLQAELSDDYFRAVEEHLENLRFRRGVTVSARLGKGNKGTDYVLRRPRKSEPWWRQWLSLGRESPYTLVIAERDINGIKALADLRGRAINETANVLAQSADHVLSFFTQLRTELGFYIGCLNLHTRLVEKGEPLCFPEPLSAGGPLLSARGLYNPCLSLTVNGRVVGNDLEADGKSLVMITGPNQGGKSTFLRSIGLAQLMMQCGMFVAADSFRASVCEGLFTHFRREEDPTMESGKLDEELRRMGHIADQVTPRSLVLFNESFSATNEREGAEIASGILRALLEAGIRVVFVTHSFELAHGWYERSSNSMLFLRAERAADGRRTFRLAEGEPLPTSYGEDLYRRIFGDFSVVGAASTPDGSAA